MVTINQIDKKTIRSYVEDHIAWSKKTFGEGNRLEGIIKHIEKEIQEVKEAKTSQERMEELVDIVILSIDAMWREGFTSEEIASALIRKQQINAVREWPSISDPTKPTEHIKE